MPKNPFRIPQFATIFELRNAELKEEAEEKERKRNLRIFERSSCKNLTSRRNLLKEEEVAAESNQLDKLKVVLQNTKGTCIEDETHQEYISKRREMFFLEYSIAIQRAEIERLDELARREEKKLDLAEQCLEQDAALFDEFLKENDKTSVEAIAAAEQEARKRSAMGDDIKRLNAQQLQITAEINRLTEVVKDYKSYKTFLDKLAPEAYRNALQRRREIKQLAKDRAKAEAKKLLMSKSPAMSEYTNYGSTVRRSSFMARRSSVKPPVITSPSPSKQVPTVVEDQDSSSSDESDNEIYFSSPEQVLEILADLEEANLRLIRNCQDTQESIESLKALSATTMERIEADTGVLVKHHHSLQNGIQREMNISKDLSVNVTDFTFADLNKSEQEQILKELHVQIQEVYRTCIQKADASLSSLQLLKEIESKMIGLLQQIQKFPEETVKEALKSKEKAHRLEVKQERKLEQRKNQEERIRKALERAKADPKKCTGRRLMTRSEPKKIERDDLKNSAQLSKEEEEMAFLFG